MTREEMERKFWTAYERIYSLRSIVRRVLSRRWRSPGRKTFELLVSNLYMRHLVRKRRVFV